MRRAVRGSKLLTYNTPLDVRHDKLMIDGNSGENASMMAAHCERVIHFMASASDTHARNAISSAISRLGKISVIEAILHPFGSTSVTIRHCVTIRKRGDIRDAASSWGSRG